MKLNFGKAKIICTVDEDNYPKEYEVEVLKISNNDETTKGMTIKVTDENLLQKTGGIIQGMSGSPIVQNGKIVGAITHVFINDPTRGYGVYIDWMIDN